MIHSIDSERFQSISSVLSFECFPEERGQTTTTDLPVPLESLFGDLYIDDYRSTTISLMFVGSFSSEVPLNSLSGCFLRGVFSVLEAILFLDRE